MASLTLIQGEAASVDDRVRAVVRVCLAAAGMKPVDLAERLGMSKHQIWDRLRGDKPFSVAEVVEMAALFQLPPQAFLAGPGALMGSGLSREEAVTIKKHPAVPGVPHPTRRPGAPLTLVAAA